jgi:hypothetical protein
VFSSEYLVSFTLTFAPASPEQPVHYIMSLQFPVFSVMLFKNCFPIMKCKSLLLFFALLAMACEVRSQASLSVQGSIQNSSGVALADGKYSIVFRLYESESGGTPVWSETQPELEVVGGLYSAILGTITPLTASFDKPYFLGLSVNDSPELQPRARLSSSAYAVSLVGQSNIFPSTGTVGVGTRTPDPTSRLHLKSGNEPADILLESSENPEIVFKKGSNTAKITFDGVNVTGLNTSSFGDDVILPAGKAIIYNGNADWRLIDNDDFATDFDGWVCHNSWVNTTSVAMQRIIPQTPFSKGVILSPAASGSNTASLKKEFDLAGIPHTMVKVVFTYHMLGQWNYLPQNSLLILDLVVLQLVPTLTMALSSPTGFFRLAGGKRRPEIILLLVGPGMLTCFLSQTILT